LNFLGLRSQQHFSYNFLLHKKYLSEHKQSRRQRMGEYSNGNNSSLFIITAEPYELYAEQQKPLTLYGIGLINQIMDFTLFPNSSGSLLLLRLSSWDCFKFELVEKILSLSVGSMKFLIKYEFIIYFLCCCCLCLLLRWATKTDRKQNWRKISFNSHLHQRKLSQSVKWTFESRRW